MASFKVTRISEGAVKPASATPDETLPLAWVDRYPTHRGLVESMHIFRSGADAAPGVIRDALAQALAFFYPLAGRIVEGPDGPGAPAIRCTADGVYFAEAEADCSLEDVRFLERPLLLPKEDLVPYPGDDRWGVEPHNTIMMMQITKFTAPSCFTSPTLRDQRDTPNPNLFPPRRRSQPGELGPGGAVLILGIWGSEMGDHKEVFRSLRELFPLVDQRILKAIAIEHRKDVDSAVVAVLDEVMPSMTGSAGVSSTRHEVVPPLADSVTNILTNQSTCEVGSSSSAGHEMRVNEVDGSFRSGQHTSSVEVKTGTRENVDDKLYVGRLTSILGMNEVNEQLNLPSCPMPNGNRHDLICDLDARYSYHSSERKLANSDNEVGYISNECFSQSRTGEMDGGSITVKAPQPHEQDSNNIIPLGDCSPQNNSSKKFSGYSDINDGFESFLLALASDNEVSSAILSAKKGAFALVVNVPCPDTEGSSGVVEQENTNNSGPDYDKQPSGDLTENGDILLSSKTDMLPDLNLNHFSSTASSHSSHSASIESLEDSIVDARSNKNDLLPSLELVTKMIEDVELLEEEAKVAKHESSVAGTGILTKVEELKEMLTHAKEANDMHAGEVFGEKSILITEACELQSRLQRLSDERNRYLVVIEEIRLTLDERLVAAQQEIAAAEKEKIEKEAAAQALLDEQEKMMNSIVEESRKLQKEGEENLKLKDFLVERGQIVDTLQGEMAVICEDVSLLKRMVDERPSLSKLQRSTVSSLSSSLHSSLHKSGSSSGRTIEAAESTDKHTVDEAASPVAKDLDDNERTVEGSNGNHSTDKGICKSQVSNEDGWEFLEDVQE